jgi:hypothetical protein
VQVGGIPAVDQVRARRALIAEEGEAAVAAHQLARVAWVGRYVDGSANQADRAHLWLAVDARPTALVHSEQRECRGSVDRCHRPTWHMESLTVVIAQV